jgi:hypothetical protein
MNWNTQLLGDNRAPRRRRHPNDGPELDKLAAAEGWYVPPPEVTRVKLRPWQQAVFWGLRIYVVVMLVLIVVGFAHAIGR